MGRIRGGIRDQGAEMGRIRGGVRDQGQRWVGLGIWKVGGVGFCVSAMRAISIIVAKLFWISRLAFCEYIE